MNYRAMEVATLDRSAGSARSNRGDPDAVEHLDQMAFNDGDIQEIEVACIGLGRNVGINEVRTENLLVDVSQQHAAERSLLVLCAREDDANGESGLLCGSVPQEMDRIPRVGRGA